MIQWRLSDYLERHDLNPNQLAVRSGLSTTTTYALASGRARRVDLATLERVLVALGEMTGESVGIEDLLEVEESLAPWKALVGLVDDPALPVDGADDHDRYIDDATNAEYEESLRNTR